MEEPKVATFEERYGPWICCGCGKPHAPDASCGPTVVTGYKPAADWRDLLSDGQRYFLNASRAESLEDRRKWISMAIECGRQAKDLC